MPQIEEAAQNIADNLKKHHADYIEARLEHNESSNIGYRGRVLEAIGKNTTFGGNVRALVRGGWGFTSFNSLDDLDERVRLAVHQARLIGKEVSRLAEVEPVQANVRIKPGNNPLKIPLARKKALLDHYNELVWGVPTSSDLGYPIRR